MIRGLRATQRGSLEAFADGLGEWVRGDGTCAGDAAGMNVAELLTIWGNYMTDRKWSG